MAKPSTSRTRKQTTKAKAPTRKAAARSPKAKTNRKAPARAGALGGSGQTITKAEFGRAARQLQLQIGSGDDKTAAFALDPREFSSGSLGWFASEKLDVKVGSKKVRCQLSLNLTVIGSKSSR